MTKQELYDKLSHYTKLRDERYARAMLEEQKGNLELANTCLNWSIQYEREVDYIRAEINKL